MIGTLNKEQIEEVLTQNVLGRIGCNDGLRTYVVPVNYVYDGKCIICHSIPGLKIEMMRRNPEVCFEVDEMKTFTNWRSVIAWGRYQELSDERDRYYAMKFFVDKMMHIKISATALAAGTHAQNEHPAHINMRPVVYRIILNEKSGRFENE
jgi:uncharacterized protein